ncbi:hypothetical protein [Massilia sp. S19_KUP03_FR1]|uniref:hypothetical protein n=1 Tax=Massilia sp. S19_KUP03_FR1 TaxID=3025503 RepID=UPI002FCDB064
MKRADMETIATLAWIETRTRVRRPATLVTVLAVVVLTWLIVVDPASGMTMIASHGARVRYTSAALAVGTASMATLLFMIAGFFLLRGRAAEDLRCGIGAVIGASTHGGMLFLVARFCGAVLYLATLTGAFMLTVLACHLVRGEGPIELVVYLQTYMLVLGPMALFTAACATLFDSWAPLMGKAGDLLFFCIWTAQIALLATAAHGAPSALAADMMGMTALITSMAPYLDVHHTMLGIADFERSQAALTLPPTLWTPSLAGMRCISALLALLPLLLALRVFHRFSPDRVRPARARARRSPLALVDSALRPLSRLTQPLFLLAARLPGGAGQTVGEIALTLSAAPSAIALLLAAQVLAVALPTPALGALALGCVACWGVLIADLSTRDGDAACASLTGAVPGGAARRYWRQLAATCWLGWLFTGLVAWRLAAADPVRGGALLAGVFALAAFASLLGSTSGTARTFLALFLLGLYCSINIDTLAWVDMVGFHGSATAKSAGAWAGAGLLAACGGHWCNRRT